MKVCILIAATFIGVLPAAPTCSDRKHIRKVEFLGSLCYQAHALSTRNIQ